MISLRLHITQFVDHFLSLAVKNDLSERFKSFLISPSQNVIVDFDRKRSLAIWLRVINYHHEIEKAQIWSRKLASALTIFDRKRDKDDQVWLHWSISIKTDQFPSVKREIKKSQVWSRKLAWPFLIENATRTVKFDQRVVINRLIEIDFFFREGTESISENPQMIRPLSVGVDKLFFICFKRSCQSHQLLFLL